MSLCLISIVEVYSASLSLTYKTSYWDPITRHATFLLTGLMLVLLTHAVKPKFFAIFGVCLPFACLLMIAARIFCEPVNNSYRWVSFLGIQFQPSEIAKLCLIAFVARILSRMKKTRQDKSLQWIGIASLITCGIIMTQNGSTAILLFFVVILMMFVAQVRLDLIVARFILNVIQGFLYCILYFISDEYLHKILHKAVVWKKEFKKGLLSFLILIVVGVSGLLYVNYLSKHIISDSKQATWINRIDRFLSEVDVRSSDFKINDKNYQPAHSCIAIANGQIFGKLPGNGTERETLPQAYSDFIYAIIIEEMGLIGGIVVIFLYVILFIRSGIIANRSNSLFSKYLVMGVAMILVIQALSNMAVAVHLIPVSGQPMPLVSRGGTSTLINCIYFGIILGVSRYENKRGTKTEEAIEKEMEREELIVKSEEVTDEI